MKVGFFTEGGFEGKITLDNINIRTDAAWMYLTDATHHPFPRLQDLPFILLKIVFCNFENI